ncbi:hypothetical protein KCG44_06780 [Pacificimonas sp. WHA3]|uniref:Carrier domain-containing protein n=1 Tax=Pacificimonas pallii TaxID=2827236 RepID=A0ABS6SDJ2_9SPHN|nr:hypothetical protein [Pacificimonas pallii]MBV7256490.1 hypothetical protein [Pacificimonas pallii]
MNDDPKEIIGKMIDLQKKLSSVTDDFSDSYLETKNDGDVNFLISGNVSGLMELCSMILDLSFSEIDGKHWHIDDLNLLENSDASFTIAFKRPNM